MSGSNINFVYDLVTLSTWIEETNLTSQASSIEHQDQTTKKLPLPSSFSSNLKLSQLNYKFHGSKSNKPPTPFLRQNSPGRVLRTSPFTPVQELGSPSPSGCLGRKHFSHSQIHKITTKQTPVVHKRQGTH